MGSSHDYYQNSSNLVPAVEKAIFIMDLLENNDAGLSVTDVSKLLELPISTVYRILYTLKYHGYVEQENDKGPYTLGPKILSLANVVKNKLNLTKIALPLMEQFTKTTDMPSKLGIYRNEELVVICTVNDTKEMSITTPIGRKFPIHAGAASKTLLAYLPQEEVDRILAAGLKKYTQYTITDPDDMRKELETIRHQGFAEDKGEYIEGVRALACPVMDYLERVVAALSVPYLATNTNDKHCKEWLTHLQSCAHEISKGLGYSEANSKFTLPPYTK